MKNSKNKVVAPNGWYWINTTLEPGTFKESGTMVGGKIIVINK